MGFADPRGNMDKPIAEAVVERAKAGGRIVVMGNASGLGAVTQESARRPDG